MFKVLEKILFFRFAYPLVLAFSLPAWILYGYFLLYKKKGLVFLYSATSIVAKAGFIAGRFKQQIINILRLLAVLLLILLAAKPELVDVRDNLKIDGIDIILSLDVSLSMNLFDDMNDRRNRLTVAKDEAINFIQNRPNDEIGIVIFATSFLKLSPPTFDKNFLKNVVENIELGVIDHQSTALGKGFCSAIAALRNSNAKSKIIILLTDGAPTAEDDIPIDKAIEMAKEFDVKVYAIGIGGKTPMYKNAFGQWFNAAGQVQEFDETIMKKIAAETGGKYFAARNPKEMKLVYETINKLETTSQNNELFTKYKDLFRIFFTAFLILFFAEFLFTTFFWKIVC